MLLAALAVTVGGKVVVLTRQRPAFFFSSLVQAVIPDILFFLLVSLIIRILFLWRPSRLAARVGLGMAALALLWSVCDICWLVHSGVQLQPGILLILVRDIRDLAPLMISLLLASPGLFVLVLCVCPAAVWLFVRRFIHPLPILAVRRDHLRWATVKLLAVVILLALGLVFESARGCSLPARYWDSAATAMRCCIRRWGGTGTRTVRWRRETCRARENGSWPSRRVRKDMPHVVLVLLESVSYASTSLGDPSLKTMPYLASLASQGVEFARTRVPVSHTTKAYWATLTGSTPVIESDYVEAVPAAQPYEGLATILARGVHECVFRDVQGQLRVRTRVLHQSGI